MLTAFFMLLSLSNGGINNFSVAALVDGYGVALTTANVALTAFLASSAFGVLAGGWLADRTRRHGDLAAGSFSVSALLILLVATLDLPAFVLVPVMALAGFFSGLIRSEEHTSELQSLMRISYAVFCLKKKKNKQTHIT